MLPYGIKSIVAIPKRNGSKRVIFAPHDWFKEDCQKQLPLLEGTYLDTINTIKDLYYIDLSQVCHGFIPGRSCVTNALCHADRDMTVCMDLTDFFDSVKTHLLPSVGDFDVGKFMPAGAARQGLPTSPMLCNLAALVHIDLPILSTLCAYGDIWTYTRYADDISISRDIPFDKANKEEWTKCVHASYSFITDNVRKAIYPHFELNEKKTRLQIDSHGRRVITGVALRQKHESQSVPVVNATRRDRRRLRAAMHQNNTQQAQGLKEWCAMKLPSGVDKRLKYLSRRIYFAIHKRKLDEVRSLFQAMELITEGRPDAEKVLAPFREQVNQFITEQLNRMFQGDEDE